MKLERILNAARASATPAQLQAVEDIQFASGFSEPGYEHPREGVALGDWNPETFDNPTRAQDIMPRLARILERAGYSVQWSDEWFPCSECGNLFRTVGDSYQWQPYHHNGVCGNCIKADPTDYLLAAVNSAKFALTIPGIDPADHGFALRRDRLENGFHKGMNDNPAEIAKALPAGTDFVFVLDTKSQFYITFSLWTRTRATCQHCGRDIVQASPNAPWVDPEATGDDSIWRETCDSHYTFEADHEPEEN